MFVASHSLPRLRPNAADRGPAPEDLHVDKRDWIRRNALRMTMLALMCLPFLMGSDCDDNGGSDAFSIVAIVFDVVLTILSLVL